MFYRPCVRGQVRAGLNSAAGKCQSHRGGARAGLASSRGASTVQHACSGEARAGLNGSGAVSAVRGSSGKAREGTTCCGGVPVVRGHGKKVWQAVGEFKRYRPAAGGPKQGWPAITDTRTHKQIPCNISSTLFLTWAAPGQEPDREPGLHCLHPVHILRPPARMSAAHTALSFSLPFLFLPFSPVLASITHSRQLSLEAQPVKIDRYFVRKSGHCICPTILSYDTVLYCTWCHIQIFQKILKVEMLSAQSSECSLLSGIHITACRHRPRKPTGPRDNYNTYSIVTEHDNMV